MTKMREYYLSRGNDIGPNELTHICLFEYHAEKNPLILVERSAYDALESERDILKNAVDKRTEMVDKLERSVRELETQVNCLNALVTVSESATGAMHQATRIKELETENSKLKAENWVRKDAALRTYDGLSEKAARADVLEQQLADIKGDREKFLASDDCYYWSPEMGKEISATKAENEALKLRIKELEKERE